MKVHKHPCAGPALSLLAPAQPAIGADWSITEAHLAFGKLDIPTFAGGGAPREGDSYMVDFNFARPFTIGKVNFSIEGHLEYIGGRDNEFGGKVEPWILAQPQFRWSPNEHLSLGLEYQYWLNKLGDGATDESTVQALLVWKFQFNKRAQFDI